MTKTSRINWLINLILIILIILNLLTSIFLIWGSNIGWDVLLVSLLVLAPLAILTSIFLSSFYLYNGIFLLIIFSLKVIDKKLFTNRFQIRLLIIYVISLLVFIVAKLQINYNKTYTHIGKDKNDYVEYTPPKNNKKPFTISPEAKEVLSTFSAGLNKNHLVKSCIHPNNNSGVSVIGLKEDVVISHSPNLPSEVYKCIRKNQNVSIDIQTLLHEICKESLLDNNIKYSEINNKNRTLKINFKRSVEATIRYKKWFLSLSSTVRKEGVESGELEPAPQRVSVLAEVLVNDQNIDSFLIEKIKKITKCR